MTDMMHAFELVQPQTLDEASDLLKKHKGDAWVIAGGYDSLDWFKDRVMRPEMVVDITQIS